VRGIIVDNFAGGGGASTGIEAALGRTIDYAINHDAEAIAMHRANHPHTDHLNSSVWDVNPRRLAAGRRVDLGWFSPDCTFHSKARGGKPFRDRDVARRRRGLAWLIPYWMQAVRPRVVMLENVEEFADWGPLLPDGKICPQRRGMTFRRWHKQIENLGYRIDMRELRACDYGAPTIRKRLFVIARCDGEEIVFPEATHGRSAQPMRTAAECIDWSIPCPSIFERTKPLAEATMRRVARGVMRYVVNDPRPFIVGGGAVRSGHVALVAAFLAKHYGGNETPGWPLGSPISTITTVDHHALVQAFLVKFYGNERDGCRVNEPMHTVTTKDRFGLVTVHGEPYRIVDIGMRMLTPRELYRAQSFPETYIIDRGLMDDGGIVPLTKTAQVRMCGNSVAPAVAEALVRANMIGHESVRAAA
jgi:DNA (cytosine-5)-methyltransferase 1